MKDNFDKLISMIQSTDEGIFQLGYDILCNLELNSSELDQIAQILINSTLFLEQKDIIPNKITKSVVKAIAHITSEEVNLLQRLYLLQHRVKLKRKTKVLYSKCTNKARSIFNKYNNISNISIKFGCASPLELSVPFDEEFVKSTFMCINKTLDISLFDINHDFNKFKYFSNKDDVDKYKKILTKEFVDDIKILFEYCKNFYKIYNPDYTTANPIIMNLLNTDPIF
jgi:hypothetical protein